MRRLLTTNMPWASGLITALIITVGHAAAEPPFVVGPFHPYEDQVEQLRPWVQHPPEVAGDWVGEDWGRVKLSAVGEGRYEGTYSDTFGSAPGRIQVKWCEASGRYLGTWREGTMRHGLISIRIMPDRKSIRGAYTTDETCEHNPGVPRLADLEWSPVPHDEKDVSTIDLPISPQR